MHICPLCSLPVVMRPQLTGLFWSQLRRFDVVSLHKGSVTSLTWSANGMKLFSGDDKGRVVFSALDLDQVGRSVTRNCLHLL